jgi:DNA segregation ATPase FtsK/SpoIIIE, S-DNA-T family
LRGDEFSLIQPELPDRQGAGGPSHDFARRGDAAFLRRVRLTAELIEILHRVPNQVLILSCLEQEWERFLNASFAAFRQRITLKPFRLDPLTEPQGVELAGRRLKDLPGRPPRQPAVWPFDEASSTSYVRDEQPTPRRLIQRCAELFEPWAESGAGDILYLGKKAQVDDPCKVFLQQWDHELEKINADPECDPENYPEERMYRAVREALSLARDAKREMGGVVFRNVQEGAVRQGGKFTRYGLRVDLSVDARPCSVVVPVYFHNNGTVFRYYLDALLEAMAAPVVGSLLVHRSSEFQMGAKAGERFEAERDKGRVRVFALEDYPLAFARLECLLRFLDMAAGEELLLGYVTLSVEDCRDYLIKTAALDNLDLFKQLGGWRPVAAPKPAPVAASAASGRPVIPGPIPASLPVRPGEPTGVPAAPPAGGLAGEVRPPERDRPDLGDHARKFLPWAEERLQKLVSLLTVWGQPVKRVVPDPVRIGAAFARLKVMPAGNKVHFKKICDKATDLRIHLGLKVPRHRAAAGLHQHRRPTARAGDRTPRVRPVRPAGPPQGGRAGLPGRRGRRGAHWLDLADPSDCHLLVAGTTGSGKSEFLRTVVAALASRLSYEQVQFFLVDPKRVTFNLGEADSPYLPRPVAYDAESALELLRWCSDETDRRYKLLAERKVTNVGDLGDKTLIPRVVVVIDEFANLLEGKESKAVLTSLLKRIGSMSRAAGIHLLKMRAA